MRAISIDRRHAPLGMAVVLVAFCCACGDADDPAGSGGTAGQGGAGTGGSGAGGGPYALDSLDEPCGPSGITAQGVLDAVADEYQASLEGEVTGPLTISLSYDGGALVCHPPYSTGETGPSLSEEVEVEVEVEFVSGNGAFDEAFSAPLTGGVSGVAPRLSHSMPASDLQGSYQPMLNGVAEVGVSFDGTFELEQTSGSIFKGGKMGNGVGSSGMAASWASMP